ncbi:MAG: PEP/pyruvate-binding domain-containing protein [Pirellulaceae bacterium]
MTYNSVVQATDFIRWFDQIGIEDVPVVGGKNASLGEMYRELASQGVRVPNGFATTADAYRYFLHCSGLDEKIPQILADLDSSDIENLRQRGSQMRHAILNAELPVELDQAILQGYEHLCRERSDVADVAVRSSATAEDLPEASFAGQQETYLNVRGPTQLLDACRRCFASLFTDRAISYRDQRGFDHAKIALSIGIQRMVRSDVGASGVAFSIDTESGFRDAVLINAAYGLGENVVQGVITPDEFCVFKPTLRNGYRPILRKALGSKEFKLIYDIGGSKMTKNVPVPDNDRMRFAIGDDDILQLAQWVCKIEDHFSSKHGQPCPVDVEWAKDGFTNELFVVQARPKTVQSQKLQTKLERFELTERGTPLVTGSAVGERIGAGRVRLIRDVHQLNEFQSGEVLVTDKTDPDWEPIMPAIVGASNATDDLADGREVTVCCAEGETGVVYDGSLSFQVNSIDLESLVRPKTQVMLNVGTPDEAFSLSFLPNDGVGLAREEFIIANHVKIHPLALLD